MIQGLIILLIYLLIAGEWFIGEDLLLIRYLHFSYLAYFLFALFFLLMLVVSRSRKMLWFLPAFVFIAVSYWLPFVDVGGRATSDGKEAPYQVMTFSVNQRNTAYKEVAKLLKENPADVVCLQEIPFSRYQRFIKALKDEGLEYHHVYSKQQGLMVLSRQPIEPLVTLPYLKAETSLGGKPLRIWNLHSPKSLRGEDHQDVFLQRLELDVDEDSAERKLICGDFNATPHNSAMSGFLRKYEMATGSMAGFSAFTYPAPGSKIKSPWPFIKIDYLLLTHNFAVKSHNRLTQFAHSDHYPVFATVTDRN